MSDERRKVDDFEAPSWELVMFFVDVLRNAPDPDVLADTIERLERLDMYRLVPLDQPDEPASPCGHPGDVAEAARMLRCTERRIRGYRDRLESVGVAFDFETRSARIAPAGVGSPPKLHTALIGAVWEELVGGDNEKEWNGIKTREAIRAALKKMIYAQDIDGLPDTTIRKAIENYVDRR